MQTKLVKIVEDTESWGDWVWRLVSENPGKAIAVAPIAIGAAVLEAPIAIAGGAAVVGFGTAYDWFIGADRVDQLPVSQAIVLQDENDDAVEVNRIYARHPLRKVFPNTVIAADKFHSQIIAEQMADIATFLKGHVRLKTLHITVSSASGAKLDGTVSAEGKELGIKGHRNASTHHELIQEETDPIIVPYDEEPLYPAIP